MELRPIAKTNKKGASTGNVKTIFVTIGAAFFVFLSLLFGNQIMSFIFGFLGPEAAGLEVTDPAYNASLQNQENSLLATNAFSERSASVSTIVIVFIIIGTLISLFLLFKDTFMPNRSKSRRGGSSFGYS